MQGFHPALRAPRPVWLIAAVLALVALLVVVESGASAVQTQGKTVRNAATLTLSGDATQTPHLMFKIGDSSVNAYCFQFEGGTVVEFGVTAGPEGAVLPGQDAVPAVVLGPNETSDPFTLHSEGTSRSAVFAVFDGTGTSASGTGATWVSPDTHKCTITAQASG